MPKVAIRESDGHRQSDVCRAFLLADLRFQGDGVGPGRMVVSFVIGGVCLKPDGGFFRNLPAGRFPADAAWLPNREYETEKPHHR